MNKNFFIEIDFSTWPKPPRIPRIPLSFEAKSSCEINIPLVLLKIGFLTTPPDHSGVSLSEFWAWVRYLSAISNSENLRLTEAFTNLDAHQKTILSDDFGMGIPMTWLTEKLALEHICDGRYFLGPIYQRDLPDFAE